MSSRSSSERAPATPGGGTVVRFRRPWLLEADYANGQKGAHCYVCELGRWWWDPGKRGRFVYAHRRCGFAEWEGYHVPSLDGLAPDLSL